MIDWLPNGLVQHSLAPPNALRQDIETLADIGCGLRPVDWLTTKRHVCVDAFAPYVKRLSEAGREAIVSTAEQFLAAVTPGVYDAIYLLDVIEHMEKPVGKRVIELAVMAQPKQVVIYTPLGYVEQVKDAWELGGEHWQRHRSGWTPADFPGFFSTEYRGDAFFAIWTNDNNQRVLAV